MLRASSFFLPTAMTVAVCLNCGEYKVGAWGVCARCGTAPETDEHLASALLFTDHYLSPEQLNQASQQITAGQPVAVDPDFYQHLLAGIRAEGLGMGTKPGADPAERRPWWKLW